MNWINPVIVAAVVAVVFMIKRSGQISVQEAVAYLKNGALVIDVRSPGEFNTSRLPAAINIPLDKIETVLPGRVKDNNQVLLLHCASGVRSAMAKRKLKSAGYANVFNLGSFARARKIINEASSG